ncbi:MAG: hypothetical protein WBW62_00880 [Solirubrobacterales bacterium]
MPLAVGQSEFLLVLVLLCVVAAPIAAFAFSKSGKGLDELGKGTFAIDRETPPDPGSIKPQVAAAEQEAEVRQMVEASAYRQSERGEGELDVEKEIDRLLGRDQPDSSPEDSREAPAPPGGDSIRDEIRQLVVANNERRERRGDEPLDIEAEVDRRLREWT